MSRAFRVVGGEGTAGVVTDVEIYPTFTIVSTLPRNSAVNHINPHVDSLSGNANTRNAIPLLGGGAGRRRRLVTRQSDRRNIPTKSVLSAPLSRTHHCLDPQPCTGPDSLFGYHFDPFDSESL